MGQTENPVRHSGGAMDSDRDSEEIKESIEDTRSRMDRTIDKLSDRVDPKAVWETVVGCFRSEGGSGNSAQGIARTIVKPIRENPLAAVALGASAVWLIVSAADDDEDSEITPRDEYPRDDDYRRQLNRPHQFAGDRASTTSARDGDDDGKGVGQKAKEKLSETGEAISDSVSAATEAVSDKLGSAKERLSDSYDDTRRTVRSNVRRARYKGADVYGGATQQVNDAVSAGRERYAQGLRENPLGLMVGALGIGLLAGVLSPVSRREEELYGEYSDSVTDQLKATGEDLVAKGKRVGERVAQKALDEVEDANLDTSKLSELADDVKETVSSAATTIKKEAEKAAEDEDITPEAIKKKVAPANKKEPGKKG